MGGLHRRPIIIAPTFASAPDGGGRIGELLRILGVFGKLGGGDTQRRGVEAVGAWFAEHAR